MQSFTRSEITWMAKAMKELSEHMETLANMAAATAVEKELYRLRAGQYTALADKLSIALEQGDRRIEIRKS